MEDQRILFRFISVDFVEQHFDKKLIVLKKIPL